MSEQTENERSEVMVQLGMSRNPLSERLDFFTNLWRRIVLSWHLVRDPQVSLLHKLIPIGTLIYVLSPLDFLPDLFGPLGMIDDIVLIGAAFDLFVRVVPPELVLKHARALGYVESIEETE